MTGDAFVEFGDLLKAGHATQRRCWTVTIGGVSQRRWTQ
jgi:hypothetical protein